MTSVPVAVMIVASLVGCTARGVTPTAEQVQESPSAARKEPTMLVTYGRGGGGRTGPDSLSVDDDGTFSLWRSNHAGPVGQFGGTLDGQALAALRADVQSAAGAGGLDAGVRLPGGRSEEITIGQLSVVLPDEDPGGPWSDLAARLRGLLDELTASPVAAVGVEVGDGKATLHHLGSEPLQLSISDLAVHVIRFGPGYARLDEWRSAPGQGVQGGGDVQADQGWTLPLPFDHGLPVEAGQSLQIVVSLSAYRDQAAYPVQIVRPPQL